jgi:type IV secretory pathway VirD2 relaxase
MKSDLSLITDEAPRSFGSDVRAAANRQGRGYLRYWPAQQTQGRTIPPQSRRDPKLMESGSQKVIVKARAVEVRQPAECLQSHLRYLGRGGVSASSDSGLFYGDCGEVDRRKFVSRAEGDYRHIRLVVSIEQAVRIPDLQPIIRELMRQMTRDVQANVDWMAVDHYNTAHPHSHIVLRVRDASGRHQWVPPVYLKVGLRMRVRAIVTRDLGPNEPHQLVKPSGMMSYHGPLAIDRLIGKEVADGRPTPNEIASQNLEERCLLKGRLRALERLGIVQERTPGTFRCDPLGQETLRRLEERDRLYTSMARELRQAGVIKVPSHLALFRCDSEQKPIIGRILTTKERHGRQDSLLVEGADGRAHHVSVGRLASQDVPLAQGMIIRVTPRIPDEQSVDRAIAAVASGNHGLYSRDRHAEADATATLGRIGKYERRLLDLAGAGIIPHAVSGVWCIGKDFLDHAKNASTRIPKVSIRVLSFEPLENLVTWRGATWLDCLGLDRLAVDRWRLERARSLSSGFLGEVSQCLGPRIEFLSAQGLVKGEAVPADLYAKLRQQEIGRHCRQLCERLDRGFFRAPTACAFRGKYRGMIALASERLAVVERRNDFTLIPWCRAIESARGRAVTITMGRDGVRIGRDPLLERKF